MTKKEIQIKAKIWRLVGELGHEDSLARLSGVDPRKDKDGDRLPMISRRDLALRWDCSVMTLTRRDKEGVLNPVRISSRLVKYKLSDIEKIESRWCSYSNALPTSHNDSNA